MKASVGEVVNLVVKGLPKSARLKVRVILDQARFPLGKVTTDAKGHALIPQFSLAAPGTYTIKIGGGAKARFVTLRVN